LVLQSGIPWLIISLLAAGFSGLITYLAASTVLGAEGARIVWHKVSDTVSKKLNRKVYGS